MNLNVVVTREAQIHVRGIIRWLRERSTKGANTWRRKWLETLERLETIAPGCSIAPEGEFHPERIQEILFKTRRGKKYRAVFVIRNETVYVFAVRGPGQDLLKPDDINLPDEL
jgi:toxin ParE1/3/4